MPLLLLRVLLLLRAALLPAAAGMRLLRGRMLRLAGGGRAVELAAAPPGRHGAVAGQPERLIGGCSRARAGRGAVQRDVLRAHGHTETSGTSVLNEG